MSENEKNYFFWNKTEFEDAVKERVCPRCPYVSFGDCKNPDPHGCALFHHLPDLVRIAQRMQNPDLKEYVRAVEAEIPFRCEQTDSPYPCNLLDTPRCGLDKLLPYVLEAVLKTDKLLEARQWGGLENGDD